MADWADEPGTRARVERGVRIAREAWSPEALGAAWTALLTPMLPEPVAKLCGCQRRNTRTFAAMIPRVT